MKKMILTLACLLGMSTVALAVSNSDVILQHGSNITVYAADDLPLALEAAVDGDVVFLNEGNYPPFEITKKITIQGVGDLTYIDGSISINIPGEPNLDAPVLQYMRINGIVTVDGITKGLKIIQCHFVKREDRANLVFNAITYDAYIDRCKFEGYYDSRTGYYGGINIGKTYTETITVNGVSSSYISPYVKGLTVTNSVISCVIGDKSSTNVTFVNCDIQYPYLTLGTVINTILFVYTDMYNTQFVNSYIINANYLSSDCTTTDCYFGGNKLAYDSEDIAANGYYGNDGTIIGPLGGATPYTLVPDVPKVTLSNLKVDTQKEELNVTLTVSPK